MFLSIDKNHVLHNFQYVLKTYFSRKAQSEVTVLVYSNSFIHRNIVESGVKYHTLLQFHWFWSMLGYIFYENPSLLCPVVIVSIDTGVA